MQIPHDTAARLTNYALDKPKENEANVTLNALIKAGSLRGPVWKLHFISSFRFHLSGNALVALCHQAFSTAFLIVHGKTIETSCCTRCDVTKAIGEYLERTFPTTIVALSAIKIEQDEVNL